MLFDGKTFAREKEAVLRARILALSRQPVLVAVLVGEDPSSVLYQRLKREAAERVGIGYQVVKLDRMVNNELRIKEVITDLGRKQDVDGVMVQLPIPGLSPTTTTDVLSAIPLTKDVDGLRWRESGIQPAAVKAILSILERISELRITNDELWKRVFVVVGAGGNVGTPLVYFLRERGVEILEVERDTPNPDKVIAQGDVVISCVGKAGVVTAESVRDGAVVVDVGMSTIVQISKIKTQNQNLKPKVLGDMGPSVYERASVAVPVPGGVGPVTVVSLLENLVDIVAPAR